MMNKKGALVLRNVMFMLIIFSTLFALSTIFVIKMADEYSNTGLQNEYNTIGAESLGSGLFGNVSDSMEIMKNNTDDSVGSFELTTGAIRGASTILGAVIKAPFYIKDSITVMMNAINIPSKISSLVTNMIVILIYSVIIFVIISALLKGGKV